MLQRSCKQYRFDRALGILCAPSLSLNMLSFILVPAEQIRFLLAKLDFNFFLLEEQEKLLSSQQCCSPLLSACWPLTSHLRLPLVSANNLGTCSSARLQVWLIYLRFMVHLSYWMFLSVSQALLALLVCGKQKNELCKCAVGRRWNIPSLGKDSLVRSLPDCTQKLSYLVRSPAVSCWGCRY